MTQPKITAIVHHADDIDVDLDIIKGGEPNGFYNWRIGEVRFFFNELSSIVDICNKTLSAIEKITRDRARDEIKEIAHF